MALMASSSERSRKLYDCTPSWTPCTLESTRASAAAAGSAASAIFEKSRLEIICGSVPQWTSATQRNPTAAERSFPGDISRYFPCSVNLYACGKYQCEPCG